MSAHAQCIFSLGKANTVHLKLAHVEVELPSLQISREESVSKTNLTNLHMIINALYYIVLHKVIA